MARVVIAVSIVFRVKVRPFDIAREAGENFR